MGKLDVDARTKVLVSVRVLDLEAIDAEAKRLRLSRSEFMVKSAQRWIVERQVTSG